MQMLVRKNATSELHTAFKLQYIQTYCSIVAASLVQTTGASTSCRVHQKVNSTELNLDADISF